MREQFAVRLLVHGACVGESVGYAWNSAVRKSEALARDYARRRGVILSGGAPESSGAQFARTWYQREWTAGNIVAIATVERER